eukprot:TRINITY_DN5314_c0_g1_i1.p1 TRINITY_DN5314_c0_g1~~TRINITY_DN5314_c0_g1_i1.p1  ORF type:complete len:472 (-),score=100.56 TRINITY_DN5314_c0_g1_i1:101-1516(-)
MTPVGLNKALRAALRFGHLDLVLYLLRLEGIDLNECHAAAVREAAVFGHAELLRVLLELPVDNVAAAVNSALTLAAQHGHQQIVEMLLTYPGADPSSHQNLALRAACVKGNLAIVDMLLRFPSVDPAARRNEPLFNASREGHLDIVCRLLSLGEAVNPMLRDGEIVNAAVEKNRVEVVRYLLQHPTVIKSPDLYRFMNTALRTGHYEIFDLFLPIPGILTTMSYSVCLNVARYGRVELWPKIRHAIQSVSVIHSMMGQAAQSGSLEMVQILIDADLMQRSYPEPLRLAAAAGHVHIVDFFLQRGTYTAEHYIPAAVSALQSMSASRPAPHEAVLTRLLSDGRLTLDELIWTVFHDDLTRGWISAFRYVSARFLRDPRVNIEDLLDRVMHLRGSDVVRYRMQAFDENVQVFKQACALAVQRQGYGLARCAAEFQCPDFFIQLVGGCMTKAHNLAEAQKYRVALNRLRAVRKQ